MHPTAASKSSFELLQLQRLIQHAPAGLSPELQGDARKFFQKTEEYLEGEDLLLRKLHHVWPLVEACFVPGHPPHSPSSNGGFERSATQRALEALGEIQGSLTAAGARGAAGL